MTITILFDVFSSMIFCFQIMRYLKGDIKDKFNYAFYFKVPRIIILTLIFLIAQKGSAKGSFFLNIFFQIFMQPSFYIYSNFGMIVSGLYGYINPNNQRLNIKTKILKRMGIQIKIFTKNKGKKMKQILITHIIAINQYVAAYSWECFSRCCLFFI